MKKVSHLLAASFVGLTGFSALTVLATSGPINVISREDGSGTRGAFVELVKVEDDQGDDATTMDADIQNSTNGVMQSIAGNQQAIGYISLGALNDSVKALKIDGVQPSADTIKAGDYKVSRPFNVAWKKDALSDIAKDFLTFIHSKEGQAIVEKKGYISIHQDEKDAKEYAPTDASGQINISGSTSVTPLMEVLAEEYGKLNPNVQINISSNGSTAGMTAAENGSADLGMASRELKDEEKKVLDFDAIALDGIVVIINKDNDLEDLSIDKVRDIFLGNITNWDDLK